MINLDKELRKQGTFLRNPKMIKALCTENTYNEGSFMGFGVCNDKILRPAEMEVIRFLKPNLNSHSRTRDFIGIEPGNLIKSWNISSRGKRKFKAQFGG